MPRQLWAEFLAAMEVMVAVGYALFLPALLGATANALVRGDWPRALHAAHLLFAVGGLFLLACWGRWRQQHHEAAAVTRYWWRRRQAP